MKSKLGLSILNKCLGAYFRFLPDKKSEKDFIGLNHLPDIGWKCRGWVLREIHSPASGIHHRYYYHPPHREDAPVFLFLHGLILDGRNFLNFGALSEHWALIAYDFPETSRFYKGEMTDFIPILDDFLNTLGLERIYLCGVSFGGGICLQYTYENPMRILGLVLASTYIMIGYPQEITAIRVLGKTILNQSDNKLYRFLSRILSRTLKRQKISGNNPDKILHVRQMDWYRQAFRSMMNLGTGYSIEVPCRVLALHGNKDVVIPLSRAYSISRYIPHADFRIVRGGTHLMTYQRGEEIAVVIRDFFQGIQ